MYAKIKKPAEAGFLTFPSQRNDYWNDRFETAISPK